MNNRSIKNNSQQQAYFTAKSGLNAVVESLNGDPAKYPFSAYLYNNLINGTHSIVIENIFENIGITDNADEIAGIGKCRIEGSYIKGEVTLKATAEAGGQTEKMTLTARRNQDGGTWPAKVWGNFLKESSVVGNIELGSIKDRKYSEDIENKEKYLIDFVVYRVNVSSGSTNKGKISIVDDATTGNYPTQAIFIYVDDNETLEIDGIENWDEDYGPDVFIYLEGNSKLKLKAQESIYPFYISVDTGAGIDIVDGSEAEVFHVNGTLTAVDKRLKFEETEKKVPKRIPTSNYNYSSNIDPINGARVNKWDVVKYESDQN
ncbi:hypothetical protein LI142_15605 [Eubacterium limosum]|uniref:Uncharacterized protein n=1 Tax=Eubacterium limosum TaxID=1736 RepID=A0ABT5USS4_EUBLI|nr:hypothetical protein [Eubacterium limosum]MCB6570928.1 hypothetical protein [Eubacterium limosum]MDE1472022.1 hypothetical protein [Eubacterium limosum]